MKIVSVFLCAFLFVNAVQAIPVDTEPHFDILPIRQTRQLPDIGVIDIVTAIYRVFRVINFTPSFEQALAILRFATRLYDVIQAARRGIDAVRPIIEQITKELSQGCGLKPDQVQRIFQELNKLLVVVAPSIRLPTGPSALPFATTVPVREITTAPTTRETIPDAE